jgi:hypothetical protein
METNMKTQLLLGLTVTNLVLLGFSLLHPNRVEADNIAPVLRGRALEIVDNSGQVRAEIKVLPAQPNFKMGDGTTGFPETVQLRLITSKGAPNVKLATMEDGSGQVLGSGSAYVQILARGNEPFMKILNQDGREQTIKP